MTKFVLIFRAGSLAGREETFTNDEIIIGRDPAHPVAIDDLKVSRDHAKIFSAEGQLLFEDLGSTNGSFINGRRVTKTTRLRNGDLISLGEENVFEVTGIETPASHNESEAVPSYASDNTPDSHDFSPLDQLPVEERDDLKVQSPGKPEESALTSGKPAAKFFASLPTWAVILFIAIGFIILFCLIPFVIIEVTNQWCNLFSGFFNAISPGVCP